MRLFLQEALSDFSATASVAPSSRYLAEAMSQPLRRRRARVVVELGPGTGAITRVLLEHMPAESQLIALEINPKFYSYLKRTLTDPRLLLLNARAESLESLLPQLGHDDVDAVVSSLGLSLMTDWKRRSLLAGLAGHLSEKGVFVQYYYLTARWLDAVHQCWRPALQTVPTLLRHHFHTIHTQVVWWNLPPAIVYVCEGGHREADRRQSSLRRQE